MAAYHKIVRELHNVHSGNNPMMSIDSWDKVQGTISEGGRTMTVWIHGLDKCTGRPFVNQYGITLLSWSTQAPKSEAHARASGQSATRFRMSLVFRWNTTLHDRMVDAISTGIYLALWALKWGLIVAGIIACLYVTLPFLFRARSALWCAVGAVPNATRQGTAAHRIREQVQSTAQRDPAPQPMTPWKDTPTGGT